MTKKTMIPTKEKLINTPAGPPLLRALPEPTSKPGPIIPGQTLACIRLVAKARHTSNRDHM